MGVDHRWAGDHTQLILGRYLDVIVLQGAQETGADPRVGVHQCPVDVDQEGAARPVEGAGEVRCTRVAVVCCPVCVYHSNQGART